MIDQANALASSTILRSVLARTVIGITKSQFIQQLVQYIAFALPSSEFGLGGVQASQLPD
ncbi:MAG TPA: hypothetical protein VKB49_22635 [Candidatus Sulfotelmatobacter sp.]|nr:hypothetical protein [Candidatus Sulfotelmatobacter sp.]